MKFKNITKGTKVLNTKDGGRIPVEPGQTVEAEMDAGELKSLAKDWWEVNGKAAAKTEKTDNGGDNGNGSDGGTYKAIHKGAGAYVIVDGEGTEVGDKITKKEAEEFNALSDEERTAKVLGG